MIINLTVLINKLKYYNKILNKLKLIKNNQNLILNKTYNYHNNKYNNFYKNKKIYLKIKINYNSEIN